MKEVREQLVFQDHLLAAVKDWKNKIIADLKSYKNIIFIGVHCRNVKLFSSALIFILHSLFRRTDYKFHYKKLFKGKLVDHQHFHKAFQVYRFVFTYLLVHILVLVIII